MAVLKNPSATAVAAAASVMDQIKLDPHSPANINYVKARMTIEEASMPRAVRRTAKMLVISCLKGEIHHPNPAERLKGGTNQVVFPDASKARF